MSHATIPDLLRLLAVPVFAWTAWRDVETRRVPGRTWLPLLALGIVALVWDAALARGGTAFELRLFLVRTAVSIGFVVPLSYLFWRIGGFGGADAKAFMVVAVLFPTYPTYELAGTLLPIHPTAVGVFSLTVLTNTVLVAAAYPLALAVRNLAAGRTSLAMFVGIPVAWDAVDRTHGRLLETPDGLSRGGLDLDALRMYLRWRGATPADLRADPETHRDPASIPAETNAPGDGQVRSDGVSELRSDGPSDLGMSDGGRTTDEIAAGTATEPAAHDDPWGARTFLDDIDHGAYGTTPEGLREGLDVLVSRESVWVSPGIPFLVPLLVGLLLALTYGDLLFGLLSALGAV